MILFTFKIISLIIGGILLYIAFFLYENEEKELTDRVQKLWIILDDNHKTSSSNINRVIQNISEILERYINSLFGAKFLSWQSLWVSSFFIYAFPFLQYGLLGFYDTPWSFVIIFLSIIFLSISHLPLLWDKLKIKFGCLIILIFYIIGLINMFILGKVIWPEDNVANMKIQLTFFVTIIFACLVFLTFIKLIKIAFGILKKNNTLLYNITFTILILLLAGSLVYLSNSISENNFFEKTIHGEVTLFSRDLDFSQLIDMGFGFIHFMAYGMVFPLILFLILLIINPIQSIFWQSINRPVYTLSKYQILKNKKLLIALAVMLLTYALPNFGKEFIKLASLLGEIK